MSIQKSPEDDFLTLFLNDCLRGVPCYALPELIDWTLLLKKAKKHKILPLLYSRCQGGIPESVMPDFQRIDGMYHAASGLSRAAAFRVSRLFDGAGVPYCLLKGLAYQHLLHAGSHLRAFLDVDFLVNGAEDALRAHEALIADGFSPGQNWDSTTNTFEKLNGFHLKYKDGHEYLEYYRQVGDLAEIVEVAIKVHTLSEKYTQRLLDRRELHSVDERKLNFASAEDILICMVENIFEDCGTPYAALYDSPKLRDFYDMARFFEVFGSKLDLTYVINTAIEESIGHKFHLALVGLKKLFPEWAGYPSRIQAAFSSIYSLQRMRQFMVNEYLADGDFLGMLSYDQSISRVMSHYGEVLEAVAHLALGATEFMETMLVDSHIYQASISVDCDKLLFQIESETDIPDDMVFSLNMIWPDEASDRRFQSLYLSTIEGRGRFLIQSSGSFHSAGNLAKAILSTEWMDVEDNSECRNAIKCSIPGFFSGARDGDSCLRDVIYRVFVHKRVVADVFHHFYGEDLDYYFASKFQKIRFKEAVNENSDETA